LKLYDVSRSPNCKKVRICARELGLELEIIPVDPRKGDNRLPEYLGKNPMGKVPTLDDNGFILWESNAILSYLCAKVPGQTLFASGPREQAETLRWLYWGHSHLAPWVGLISMERVIKPLLGQPGNDAAIIYVAEAQLPRFLPVLEKQLTAHPYVTGVYSIADISLGCIAEWCTVAKIDLATCPSVGAWLKRLQAREAWTQAV
jgi:glutathione S-transferase